MSKITPVALLILDGFGYREEGSDNAILHAKKPNWDHLWASNPHTTIDASEHAVGLPKGQFGNSEVGHLNIGAGRIVRQDITRIDVDIEAGTLGQNPLIARAIELARSTGHALHIMGLASDGGVHSHENHIFALIEAAATAGVERIIVHAFLDGRDTPPRSAETYLARLEAVCAKTGGKARIASIVGRYFAMDRDKRWERVEPAYDLLTQGMAPFSARSAAEGLAAAYARGENDEFVQATAIQDAAGQVSTMRDGDVLIFANFRADRARQITQALDWDHFDGFARKAHPKLALYASMTSYGEAYANPAAYPPVKLSNTIGEYLASKGLNQLRIAETEKYPHVTYFFSGGEETPFAGEDRVLVPSPKVATYDLQPEMSAFEVTTKIEEAIASGKYHAIFVNYANGDMVGHTGNFDAAVKAVETLDACVQRVVDAMRKVGGEVLITADHGNCEDMFDEASNQQHTQHTMYKVPLLYIGRPAKTREGGALQDIAPTLLSMMGLEIPSEMTGKPLVQFS
ncbi:2,3-bisphosphoglycerate-independent phosphoglycerate mutase [Leeia oryzae]|uniref:2,3-bisphosphoglycerate-independent phosphoglycerate mutase n=1 Tax=Leeia oryzae TaxID=356662 RepID=UPI000367E4F6|nr:2,3-bisphosphoglycerate-independent phosphoglycerate mutase [Leeia oryzae]